MLCRDCSVSEKGIKASFTCTKFKQQTNEEPGTEVLRCLMALV